MNIRTWGRHEDVPLEGGFYLRRWWTPGGDRSYVVELFRGPDPAIYITEGSLPPCENVDIILVSSTGVRTNISRERRLRGKAA